MTVEILLVDDHELVREGVRALLEKVPRYRVVGEAGDGQEGIRLARELRPQVVLMDIGLPGGLGGLEATEAILADCPETKVILLTQYENREYIRRAIRLGAHGYLLKQSASERLIEAIDTVARGERYLHPRVTSELVEMVTLGDVSEDDEMEALTPRERQVFKLLAEGRTCRELSRDLGLSVKTAMTHRSNLMSKLGLHSRAELIKLAIRKRVIEI